MAKMNYLVTIDTDTGDVEASLLTKSYVTNANVGDSMAEIAAAAADSLLSIIPEDDDE